NLDPEKASNSPVIADAVVAAFFDDTPPEVTIGAEKNLARFCNVTRASSKVREGVAADDATGRETPLGKVTRWYRSTRSSVRLLQRLVSGKDKRPAKAEHVTLAQDLTDSCIPRDLDFGHYIGEARKVYNSVPGPHRFARALLPDHGPARAVLDAGLVPHPKNGKDLPLGSVVTNPTFLWDWNKYRTAGTLTGPEWGILALDIDEPGKFAAGVDRNGSPLLESRWADLEGCLVSSRGASHPDAVRSGTGRGKMLFRFHADAEHPLAKMPINRRKEALGVEVFFGRGVPSVAGEGPDGTTYQLDGTLGPPPEWLIDLLTGPYRAPRAPRKASPGTKGKKQVARGEGRREGRDDRGEGRGDLFSLDPRPSTLGPPVPSALDPRPSIRGPQEASRGDDGGSLEDEAGDASEGDLEALMEVLAEVEPRLDESAVGWREKDLGDGRVILAATCPFDHDSGTSSDGDLAAGFSESGRPWLRCQHASCTEVPDAAGRLAAEYLRRRAVARIDAARAAAPPLDLSAIARVVIASLDMGDVSIEKAPTGSGKSFSLGQAAVARLREDKVSLIACPTVKLCEEMRDLIGRLAPEVVDTDLVAAIYGRAVRLPGSSEPADSEEFDSGGGHYPIFEHTRIVLCTHAQLARKGFSKFLRGFWTAIKPGDTRPAPAILIDEVSALIQACRVDLPLEHRVTTRHDPDRAGGHKVPLRDCPRSNRSGNCANCTIHRPFGFGYGAKVAYNIYGIRELVPPRSFDFNATGGLTKTEERRPVVVEADDLTLGLPELRRVGDTAFAANVVAYRGREIESSTRRTAPVWIYKPDPSGVDPNEDPAEVLGHMLDFAHHATLMVEHAVGPGGIALTSAELEAAYHRDRKHWADGIVFPRETCEVPRLRFTDLLCLEQVRRFADANHVGVAFADATLSDSDAALIRDVFPAAVLHEHPYPDRKVDQVAIVALDGKYGQASLVGDNGKLVTEPLEKHTQPDGGQALGIVFLPTRRLAEALSKVVMRNQESVRLAAESYTEGILRAALERDVPIGTYVTYSRGVLGRGANLLGICHLLVDANAFRAVSGFAAATITPDEFARLRAEERLALVLQNIGRCLRGEDGKRVAIFVLNADAPLIDLLAACPAVVEGSTRPPVVTWSADLPRAVEQADRWLPTGGAWPTPTPPPTTKRKGSNGRPRKTLAGISVLADQAVAAGTSWREFYRANHLDRDLDPADVATIKARFGSQATKGP
ncbi:MAG: hypothetical protein JOZ53_03960, partial [Planctomycetaceae bacterium]|nr:hypothetical protein [Planctomycetaceae bacterium]